jgi:hypothetical protein
MSTKLAFTRDGGGTPRFTDDDFKRAQAGILKAGLRGVAKIPASLHAAAEARLAELTYEEMTRRVSRGETNDYGDAAHSVHLMRRDLLELHFSRVVSDDDDGDVELEEART